MYVYFRSKHVYKGTGTLDMKIKYQCDPVMQSPTIIQSSHSPQQSTESTELEVNILNCAGNNKHFVKFNFDIF